MVVVMSPKASDEDIARVVEMVEDAGGDAFVSRGKHRTIIGLVGDTERFMALPIPGMPGVESVMRIGKPYKLVARESRPEPSEVQVGDVVIGRDSFAIIAGPCAIETEEQAMASARAAKAAGAHILRGDAYKHRTSPYAFQGLAKRGLEILAQMRAETGMPTVTEVLQTTDVELVASYSPIAVRFCFGFAIGRPTAFATAMMSATSSATSSVVIACGPSHSATSGRGCTSTMIPSAPTATAARASGPTSSRFPPECDGSTMIGRCDREWISGTDEMSSVLRVIGS